MQALAHGISLLATREVFLSQPAKLLLELERYFKCLGQNCKTLATFNPMFLFIDPTINDDNRSKWVCLHAN